MAVRDLQQGVRLLWRSPGFTVTAVITLALGIGATTAIFSAVNAVLLNPFPYADPARIMQIAEHGKDPNDTWGVSYPNYLDWKKQQTSFEAIAAVHGTQLTVTGRGEPVRVQACAFSASAVTLLGVPPLLGRGFREDEDREGAPRVVLVGHRFWQERLDANPNVVGQTLSLDNQAYTIVGVMPPRFAFYGADVWVPIGLNFVGEVLHSRVAHPNGVIARLGPGVTLEQARAELRVIARRLAAAYPDTNGGMSARVDPLLERVVAGIKPTLLVLLGAVTFLLLVACANVANLLLARAATRRKEMAVRLALGASRMQLFRQVIVECIPLAVLGAAAGLFLAYAITQAVVALLPAGSIPAEASIRIDGRVLLFSLALSLGATIACAAAGALPRSVLYFRRVEGRVAQRDRRPRAQAHRPRPRGDRDRPVAHAGRGRRPPDRQLLPLAAGLARLRHAQRATGAADPPVHALLDVRASRRLLHRGARTLPGPSWRACGGCDLQRALLEQRRRHAVRQGRLALRVASGRSERAVFTRARRVLPRDGHPDQARTRLRRARSRAESGGRRRERGCRAAALRRQGSAGPARHARHSGQSQSRRIAAQGDQRLPLGDDRRRRQRYAPMGAEQRAAGGGLCAVRAGDQTAILHACAVLRLADGLCADGDRVHGARAGLGRRSRSADQRVDDDGRSRDGNAQAATLQHARAHRLREHGHAPRGGRHLRRDVLFRPPAHARSRHPHGARCGGTRRARNR